MNTEASDLSGCRSNCRVKFITVTSFYDAVPSMKQHLCVVYARLDLSGKCLNNCFGLGFYSAVIRQSTECRHLLLFTD
jgi:hypothetical protein